MTVGLAGCAGFEGSLRDNKDQPDGYDGEGVRVKTIVSDVVEPRLLSPLIEGLSVLILRQQRWSWMVVRRLLNLNCRSKKNQ